MKRFSSVMGSTFALFVIATIIFSFIHGSLITSAYEPPKTDQMYFSRDSSSDDQYAFVVMKPDRTITLIRSQTDVTSYYADTTTVYNVSGSEIHPIVGNLYFKEHDIPFANISIYLPFLGKPGTHAVDARLECTYANAYNATNSYKVGDKFHDILYYSDNDFYLGPYQLKRVYEWPDEIMNLNEITNDFLNGIQEYNSSQTWN